VREDVGGPLDELAREDIGLVDLALEAVRDTEDEAAWDVIVLVLFAAVDEESVVLVILVVDCAV
jgi:hypothetical protein